MGINQTYSIPRKILTKSGVTTFDGVRRKAYYNKMFDLQTGDAGFELNIPFADIDRDSFVVYRNGGEALVEGTDYNTAMLEGGKKTWLGLRHPAKSTDTDIEVRTYVWRDQSEVIQIPDVRILPRKLGNVVFTNEQLMELVPNPRDQFEVSNLMKYGNLHLSSLVGRRAIATEMRIDETGIMATIQLI